MSGTVEARFYHGDNIDRASKVSMSKNRNSTTLICYKVYGAASEQEAPTATRRRGILDDRLQPDPERHFRSEIRWERDTTVWYERNECAWDRFMVC
jgi:hypothetical protein